MSKLGRIRIILTDYFLDYRQESYIGIRNEWSTIRDMIKSIKKTFQISDNIYLTTQTDGIHLPAEEPIAIIDINDIIVVNSKKGKVEGLFSEENFDNCGNEYLNVIQKIKRNYRETIPLSGIENECNIDIGESQLMSTFSNSTDNNNNKEEAAITNDTQLNEDNCLTIKRRRIRKRKRNKNDKGTPTMKYSECTTDNDNKCLNDYHDIDGDNVNSSVSLNANTTQQRDRSDLKARVKRAKKIVIDINGGGDKNYSNECNNITFENKALSLSMKPESGDSIGPTNNIDVKEDN